jgi:hypothetical protein
VVHWYFGRFISFEYILVIMVFSGVNLVILEFLGYLVILGVWYYFGHYGVFGVILVILEFSGLFWLF